MDNKKKKSDLKIGTKINFHSGKFDGLTGVITELDWDSKDKRAIYGFLHTVELSNGNIGFIEKSEHFTIIKSKQQSK
jgi:transcription antitermination factor NusG